MLKSWQQSKSKIFVLGSVCLTIESWLCVSLGNYKFQSQLLVFPLFSLFLRMASFTERLLRSRSAPLVEVTIVSRIRESDRENDKQAAPASLEALLGFPLVYGNCLRGWQVDLRHYVPLSGTRLSDAAFFEKYSKFALFRFGKIATEAPRSASAWVILGVVTRCERPKLPREFPSASYVFHFYLFPSSPLTEWKFDCNCEKVTARVAVVRLSIETKSSHSRCFVSRCSKFRSESDCGGTGRRTSIKTAEGHGFGWRCCRCSERDTDDFTRGLCCFVCFACDILSVAFVRAPTNSCYRWTNRASWSLDSVPILLSVLPKDVQPPSVGMILFLLHSFHFLCSLTSMVHQATRQHVLCSCARNVSLVSAHADRCCWRYYATPLSQSPLT
jgi:hypothetical protein